MENILKRVEISEEDTIYAQRKDYELGAYLLLIPSIVNDPYNFYGENRRELYDQNMMEYKDAYALYNLAMTEIKERYAPEIQVPNVMARIYYGSNIAEFYTVTDGGSCKC